MGVEIQHQCDGEIIAGNVAKKMAETVQVGRFCGAFD
jgi:hypothetical protein